MRAQNATNQPAFLPNSESPDKSLALSLVANDKQKVGNLRLISLKGKPVKESFPLSTKVQTWNARQVRISSIIWTDDSSAVAFMIGDGKSGEAYACVKMANGIFKAVNLTGVVEGAHLGALGRPATDFTRSEHMPMKWGEWTAQYGHVIWVKNHFWDKRNRRYTINSPFMISNNGEVGGQ